MHAGAIARHVVLALIGLGLVVSGPDISAAAANRQALVIGNNKYTSLGPLENAGHDAAAIAESLKQIGFEVDTVLDGDLDEMKRAVVEFSSSLDENTVSLFYYAGHGVQYDGVNFLIPTDYGLGDPSLLGVDSLALDEVVTRVASADNRLAIYILDACRDNPFADTRGAKGGLAPIDAPYGSFIAFATAPGQVAYDGSSDEQHGTFTAALLDHIASPGLRLEDVFKLVRRDVVSATEEKQVPWTSSSLVGDFYFSGDETDASLTLADAPKPEAQASPLPDEYLHWASIKGSNNIGDYEVFMATFPQGDLYEVADVMRTRLQQEETAQSKETETAALSATTNGEQDQRAVCDICPEMVEIGPGSFRMGSDGFDGRSEPDEQPVHDVTLHQSLEMSRFEITQAEFDRFVDETGYAPETKCGHPAEGSDGWAWIEPLGWWQERDPEHPATCVSWLDAVSYTKWLSEKTGDSYRLPTEAEWEFAARGGQQTERYWGNAADQACRYANSYDQLGATRFPSAKTAHQCDDGYAMVAPVGMFEANAFALHDMLGNAAEWVQDCRTESYDQASGRAEDASDHGQCAYRTLRGGSWHSAEDVTRAAYRDWTTPITRGSMIGFRVVRDMHF